MSDISLKDTQHVYRFLERCDVMVIRFIELQVVFARDARNYMTEYGISKEDFAREWGCDVKQVEKLIRGACDISIKDMAKLEILYANRIAAENAALKVKK